MRQGLSSSFTNGDVITGYKGRPGFGFQVSGFGRPFLPIILAENYGRTLTRPG